MAPNAARDDAVVRAYYEKAADDAWGKALRARAYALMRFDECASAVEAFNRYAEFFGIADRMTMPAGAAELRATLAERAEVFERKRAAAIEASRAKRAAAAAEREILDAVAIAEWVRGERRDCPYTERPRLRLRGDTIETSHGASVPVEVAPMLWDAVQGARLAGVDVDYTGHHATVGRYTLETIRADGDIVIGWHEITNSELERIAGLLGLGIPARAVA
jgi:hypothetical protein